MFNDQKIEAIAYKKAVAKSKKIEEFGIYPTMPEVEQDALVLKLRDAKMKTEEGLNLKDVTRGQRFYVDSLIKFSGMTATQKWEHEYNDLFAELGDDDDRLSELEAISVKGGE